VTNWQIVDPREKPEAICIAELLNVLLRAKKLVLRNLIEEFLNLRWGRRASVTWLAIV
jgi:hypothetical protein